MNGADYRIKAEHPRRPGQPLRITDRAGRELGRSGDSCDGWTVAQIESGLRNGYLERITPAATPRRARKAEAPSTEEE